MKSREIHSVAGVIHSATKKEMNSTCRITTVIFLLLTIITMSVSGHTTYNTTCIVSRKTVACNGEFVCRNGTCSSCINDRECDEYPAYVCRSTYVSLPNGKQLVHECTRKKLFPMSWQDGVITIASVLGGIMSTAGLGGGTVYLPFFTLVGRYSLQVAVPISSVMILACSISNLLLLIPRKNPTTKNRPMINYMAVLIFQPIILAGSSAGVFLNSMFPNWLLNVLLVILLGYNIIRMTIVGIQRWRKEREQMMKKDVNADNTDVAEPTTPATPRDDIVLESWNFPTTLSPDKTDPLVVDTPREHYDKVDNTTDVEESKTSTGSTESTDTAEAVTPELHDPAAPAEKVKKKFQFFDFNSQQFPIIIYILLTIPWIIVFIITLLSGGNKRPSVIGVRKCGAVFWGLTSMLYPLLFIFSYIVGIFYYIQFRIRKRKDYIYEQGDIKWKIRNSLIIPVVFLFAGMCSSMLG